MINLSNYVDPLLRKLDDLEKRERHMVIAGIIFVILSIFYLAIWDPIVGGLAHQQQEYQSQRQLLNWMREKTQEINSLKSSGAQTQSRFKNQSVSALVELSAQSLGVKQFIKKQDSQKNEVKVQMQLADFDRVILWLDELERKYGVQASSIQIEPQKDPGTADIRVTLERIDS